MLPFMCCSFLFLFLVHCCWTQTQILMSVISQWANNISLADVSIWLVTDHYQWSLWLAQQVSLMRRVCPSQKQHSNISKYETERYWPKVKNDISNTNQVWKDCTYFSYIHHVVEVCFVVVRNRDENTFCLSFCFHVYCMLLWSNNEAFESVSECPETPETLGAF